MITLITGGSGSGKSAYAEDCLVAEGEGRRIYIATMHPFDEESYRRIDRHRNMRAGKGFETIERYTNLKDLEIPEDSYVLLECMSNLVANELYQEDGAGEETVSQIWKGIENLDKKAKKLYIVTNEIFSDGEDYPWETRQYLQDLGALNCKIAKMADRIIEVIYGIPVERKKTI